MSTTDRGADVDSLSAVDGPAARTWARLAVVRRTLEWFRGDAGRLDQARYLGANCRRLLDQAEQLGSPEPLPPRLDELLAALDTADDVDGRQVLLDEACAAMDALLPLASAGTTMLPMEPQARLVLPRRRRGRADRRDAAAEGTGDGAPAGKAAEGPAAAAADTAAALDAATASEAEGAAPTELVADDSGGPAVLHPDADDPLVEAGPSSAAVGTPTGAEEPDLDAELAALFADARRASSARSGRKKKGPEASPDSQRLPFHHEERGGRALSDLDGADPDVVEALAAQGVCTVADLLALPPQRFQRRPQLRAGSPPPDDLVMVRGPVLSRVTRFTPGLARREVTLQTRDGIQVRARWLAGRPRGFDAWQTGAELALVGRVELDEIEPDDVVLDVPDAQGDTDSDAAPPASPPQAVLYEGEPVGLDGRGSGLLACYDRPGVDDRSIRDLVARAVGVVLGAVKDTLPPQILDHQRLLALDAAIRDAHFPANTTGRGRSRLAFEELFLLQLGVALRSGRGRQARGVNHRALHGFLGQLQQQHGITLDDGQERAFCEIRRDLVRSTPMTRLLQGDVGAGKGLVALMSAVMVVENRTQVAMVCPDGLTAERRFLFAEPLLRSLGVAPLLVGDRVSHAQADAIRRGEANIVFGTADLLAAEREWKRLGLVVVEERDHYGTVDPARLRGRGPRPDLLVMTTAPIPASLVFSVFGEFDLSTVPRRSRTRAVPRVVGSAQRGEAYAQVQVQLDRGHQAYVVFPVSDGRDLLSADDARRFAEALRTELLPGARLAVYSSAMSRDERLRVFDDFRHRRIDVLVSTTFVEDAPAVDNATAMVVEHADKHSLIRLHRLRGHLRHGTCFMVMGDPPNDDGVKLVDLAAAESDGYRLAEIDLQVRGLRALLGDRAKEAPSLCWADPPQDRALLLRARDEAFGLAKADPDLRRWRGLGRAVNERWGEWLGDAVVPPPPPRGSKGRSRRRRRRRRR